MRGHRDYTQKRKKEKKRKKDKGGAEEGVETGLAAYGLSGSQAPPQSKQQRRKQKGGAAVDKTRASGVVGLTHAKSKQQPSGDSAQENDNGDAAPSPLAQVAPMFAAQMSLGMGGGSAWD